MQEHLHDLLDDAQRYAPEYRGGLSNHLPMALAALDALGASSQRLCSFASEHARRLEPRQPGRAIDAAFDSAFERHLHAIEHRGIDAALREVLPRLMPGVGAAAFHGLIRTAYGVQAGHAGEIAAGLAYWDARFLPLLPALPAVPGDRGIGAWLGALAAALPGWSSPHALIFERMAAVAETPAFREHAARLAIDEQTPRAIAALALDRYLASGNFTVLHVITSCHALRTLGPWLERPAEAWRWYSVAVAAGVVSSGVDLAARVQRPEPPPWNELIERAIASSNDHAIKLAHSAHAEAQAWGEGERYRQAVALVLGD